MKRDAAFVACSKTKADRPLAAAALYASPLYRKSLLAALDSAKSVFILSAKHGVLRLSDRIEPYDTTLKRMPQAERSRWGEDIDRTLDLYVPSRSAVNLFCGEEYITPLRASFSRHRYSVHNPLVGQSLGQRLRTLREMIEEEDHRRLKSRFDRILHNLWIGQAGGRLISETTGKQSWPRRGVYFVLDSTVAAASGRMPRIVRVGTHAVSAGSKTTLWDRLSTHRGTTVGSGSHRSSIFRSHVGRALMARDGLDFSTWGQGQSAPKDIRDQEQELERKVSDTLGGMRLLWIDIPDDPGAQSDRAFIERNSIGLLSRLGLLSPTTTKEWLGHYSVEWRISVSGLWNLDHLFLKPDAKFLDVLKVYVDLTLGRVTQDEAAQLVDKQPHRLAGIDQLTLFSEGN
ncbi:hypothetical protein QO010_000259 [Caulobacter ginsengisoli]|uniref:Uncharacterized protein n=1 Tax=Caulobacter ginsengisoli TaxID=400775 RepID=A0ABU0IM95_9CAUL|nr:DUF6884 domain-containing protein [Caulobacter ginsengisoli]MDQ0462511.1 hypothetical protein [Caulobacter ginsengisoli]